MKASALPCLHSVGAPLSRGKARRAVALQPGASTSCHFPETREIWSFGSGYGGNALLGQEVLRAADRFGDGPRRGLAGRAHADLEAHLPCR